MEPAQAEGRRRAVLPNHLGLIGVPAEAGWEPSRQVVDHGPVATPMITASTPAPSKCAAPPGAMTATGGRPRASSPVQLL